MLPGQLLIRCGGFEMPAPKIDTVLYERNRSRIPPETLEPYAGEHVAFSADGTRVIAHGPDYESVEAELRSLGLDTSEVVWERVPGPGEETWL
jgi:hypothetical protein